MCKWIPIHDDKDNRCTACNRWIPRMERAYVEAGVPLNSNSPVWCADCQRDLDMPLEEGG